MRWRLIEAKSFDAYMNMALEEVLLEEVRNKEVPIIRLFTWSPSAVSLGYFQSLKAELNEELCKSKGIDIVRRITGGGAVLHGENKEITYSVIAPEKLFSKDIIRSYGEICSYIVKALKKMGMDAEFKPINDVLVDGCKISGSAQTRKGGVLLQHGTLIYDINQEEMFELLKGRIVKNNLTKSAKKVVTCVKDHKDISFREAVENVKDVFVEDKEFFIESYSEEELSKAKDLADKKYSCREWINLR